MNNDEKGENNDVEGGLLPHRGGSSLAQFAALGLLFLDTGGQELGVVIAVIEKKAC